MSQFVTRKTPAEMAAESKKATEEGLKAVAAALNRIEEVESDSDSDEYRTEYRRHSDPNRHLQLELANAKVDIADLTNELDELKGKFELFKKINNEFDHLNNLDFYTKDINILTLEQAQKKLALYKEDENERSKLCMNYITKVDLPYIRRAMILSTISCNKKNLVITNNLTTAINNKIRAQQIELWLNRFGAALIIVLLAIVWTQKIELVAHDY